jgi:hypothetical protein
VIQDHPAIPRVPPLDRERHELDVAIALVSCGVARRMIVAGLGHVPELLARMRGRATLAGVRLESIPTDPRAVLVAPRPHPLP